MRPLPAVSGTQAKSTMRFPRTIRLDASDEHVFERAAAPDEWAVSGAFAFAQLASEDLRGKTGTSNSSVDTWFNGFNDSLVATVWVGTDDNRPLGEGEEGAPTAVPIWVDYMREALRGVPERKLTRPDGIIEMKVNASTGGRRDADLDPVFEYFRVDMLPSEEGYIGDSAPGLHSVDTVSPDPTQGGADPIF